MEITDLPICPDSKKRSRTQNWTSQEKNYLIELCRSHLYTIEIKKYDAYHTNAKNKVWSEIHQNFCNRFGSKRAVNRLKEQWRRIKAAARLEKIQYNGSNKEPSLLTMEICNMLEDVSKLYESNSVTVSSTLNDYSTLEKKALEEIELTAKEGEDIISKKNLNDFKTERLKEWKELYFENTINFFKAYINEYEKIHLEIKNETINHEDDVIEQEYVAQLCEFSKAYQKYTIPILKEFENIQSQILQDTKKMICSKIIKDAKMFLNKLRENKNKSKENGNIKRDAINAEPKKSKKYSTKIPKHNLQDVQSKKKNRPIRKIIDDKQFKENIKSNLIINQLTKEVDKNDNTEKKEDMCMPNTLKPSKELAKSIEGCEKLTNLSQILKAKIQECAMYKTNNIIESHLFYLSQQCLKNTLTKRKFDEKIDDVNTIDLNESVNNLEPKSKVKCSRNTIEDDKYVQDCNGIIDVINTTPVEDSIKDQIKNAITKDYGENIEKYENIKNLEHNLEEKAVIISDVMLTPYNSKNQNGFDTLNVNNVEKDDNLCKMEYLEREKSFSDQYSSSSGTEDSFSSNTEDSLSSFSSSPEREMIAFSIKKDGKQSSFSN